MLHSLEPLAREAKSWPFEQARNLLAHVLKKRLDDAARADAAALIDAGKADEALAKHAALQRPVIFETGYGPSGLPHIGTFGEVIVLADLQLDGHLGVDGSLLRLVDRRRLRR